MISLKIVFNKTIAGREMRERGNERRDEEGGKERKEKRRKKRERRERQSTRLPNLSLYY
jgi:hypothetical protein